METCIIYKRLRVVKTRAVRRTKPSCGAVHLPLHRIRWNLKRCRVCSVAERRKKRGYRVIIIITTATCHYGAAQAVSLCERALRAPSVVLCHSTINLQDTVRWAIFLFQYGFWMSIVISQSNKMTIFIRVLRTNLFGFLKTLLNLNINSYHSYHTTHNRYSL